MLARHKAEVEELRQKFQALDASQMDEITVDRMLQQKLREFLPPRLTDMVGEE
jgi:hypothetical protein